MTNACAPQAGDGALHTTQHLGRASSPQALEGGVGCRPEAREDAVKVEQSEVLMAKCGGVLE